MTAPALYTPSTVKRIRILAAQSVYPEAIARDLGWDVAQLGRVARKHGIEIADVTSPRTPEGSHGG